MLKYCLIDSAIRCSEEAPSGIRQWAKAFSGVVMSPEIFLASYQQEQFDIVHINLLPENYSLIASISSALFLTTTKILLSYDQSSEDCPAIFQNSEALRTCCEKADLIFATHHLSVKFLEEILSSHVYELHHPVDFCNIQRASNLVKKVTFLRSPTKNTFINKAIFNFLAVFFKFYEFKLLFNYQFEIIDRPDYFSWEFQQRLANSEFIFCPDEKHNYGEDLFYAAARGCKIFGTNNSDIIRRCFSLGASEQWSNLKNTFLWLLSSPETTQFFSEHASEKMEYYNFFNSKKKLLNILKKENLIASAQCNSLPKDNRRVNYYAEMNLVSGARQVILEDNDFAVVCLEKNGQEYLPSFLKHYRKLGAKHFFFIDNNSEDNTLAILREQPDVSVYQTSLKHRKYESEIRRVIIDEHCKGAWCMCVDIDELFDYPHSDQISTKDFIEYLRVNNFTSVVGYMLDMFSVSNNMQGTYLEDIYTHYDITHIEKADYFSSFTAFNNFNTLSNKNVCLYYGGVRQSYVGKNSQSKFLLVKHPLFYIDHHIEPVSMPHFCNKTKVADISCVLKHYKLTFSLKEKIDNGVAQDEYSYMIKDQIDAYKHMTGNAKTLTGSINAEKYTGIDKLIKDNFVQVTNDYQSFVFSKVQQPA